MNDNLQQMPRLKTALLTCMHMEARIPVLALSALLCLEHLSLQDVYPEQLSIPPACRLDVHGEAQGIQQVRLLWTTRKAWSRLWHEQSLRAHPNRCRRSLLQRIVSTGYRLSSRVGTHPMYMSPLQLSCRKVCGSS